MQESELVGKHDNEGKSGVIEMSEGERGRYTGGAAKTAHNRSLKVEAPLSRDAETPKCL